MNYVYTLLTIGLLWIGTTACSDLDHYSNNPAHRLTFSCDTVSFDTLFTTIGSSTNRLLVYNPNPEALNIASISLESGGEHEFYLNVDGVKGSSFENVYLRARDSLYLFIEATLHPTLQDQPSRVEDRLLFNVHSQPQTVVIQAWAQDAWKWNRKTIDHDTTLTGNKPIVVYDTLFVRPGATLTTQPGTTLCFHHKAAMVIEGCWQSEGTVNNPVILRGDRTDRLFNDLPYDLVSGQWEGVQVTHTSTGNDWRHTFIRNTCNGVTIDSTDTHRRKLRMESCRITNSSGPLFTAINAWIEGVNCEITNAARNVGWFIGGQYRFTHCTFANYYRLGATSAPTLVLQNYREGRKDLFPLIEANFSNCIIDGRGTTEVALYDATKELTKATPFNHRFDHCLIRTAGKDDENFIQTVWNENALFVNTATVGYAFDFRLDTLSKARSAGADQYASEVPVDFYGISRPSVRPDLGAYQTTNIP